MKTAKQEMRHQAYLRHRAKGTYYYSNEYAVTQREKHKVEINAHQQKRRRDPKTQQYDKLVCDARRHIGIPPTKMNMNDKEILLYHRLFRLVEGKTITKQKAREIIDRFKKEPDEALLDIYQYRVRPNVLGINHLTGKGVICHNALTALNPTNRN